MFFEKLNFFSKRNKLCDKLGNARGLAVRIATSVLKVQLFSSNTSQVNAGGSRGSTPTEFASHRKVEVHPDVLAQRVRSVLQFMHER